MTSGLRQGVCLCGVLILIGVAGCSNVSSDAQMDVLPETIATIDAMEAIATVDAMEVIADSSGNVEVDVIDATSLDVVKSEVVDVVEALSLDTVNEQTEDISAEEISVLPPRCDPDNPKACSDGDRCTNDWCDPAVGCLYSTVVCDDSNKCTRDSCNQQTGACVFVPIVCDDDNDCTIDSCNPDSGKCVFDPVDDNAPCDDGTLCTTEDHCAGGKCIGTVTDPDMAPSLQNLLVEYLAFSGDPGVSAAVRFADGCIWSGAAGMTTIQTNELMTTTTQFRVGSFTKLNMAILVMMLAEDGLVDLDTSITAYLPDYPQWSDVTVRMVLGMQSGIPDYLLNEDFAAAALYYPGTLDGPDALLSFVKDLPFEFEPGHDCLYSDSNYVIAGMISKATTGHEPEVDLRTRIYQPLGLERTFLDVTDTTKPNLANGYMDLGIVAPLLGLADKVSMFPDDWFLEGLLIDATYVLPQSATWAAGALVSTPQDAVAILHALFSGQLLSPASLAQMQVTYDECLILGVPVEYGLGIMTKPTWSLGNYWGHGGLQFGYESNTMYLPDLDLTLSHMHNFLPSQYEPVQNEILAQATVGPGAGIYEPCLVPAGFFTEEDNRVSFRFKGQINLADELVQLEGTPRIRGMLAGEDVPLYGTKTSARRIEDEGGARIEVVSFSPSMTEGVDLRRVILTVDAALISTWDGTIALEGSAAQALVFTVAELGVLPAEGGSRPGCIVAVPDGARASKIHLCGGDDFDAENGEMLKLFADIAVTMDVDAVTAYLGLHGIERCF